MIKSVGKYDKHDVSGRSFSRDNLWKERYKDVDKRFWFFKVSESTINTPFPRFFLKSIIYGKRDKRVVSKSIC